MNAAEKTQKEIAEYLKMHVKDGKLTKSLVEIGKDVGFSNATIYRALQGLEEKGVIEISPSDKRSVPNTIYYRGQKTSIDEFLAEGVELAEEMLDLHVRMKEYVKRSERLIRSLKNQNDLLISEKEREDNSESD